MTKLSDIMKRYPVVWRGNLALKDAQAMVMMHCISGNVKFARSILRRNEVDPTPMKITHKRRLIPEALKEVIQKIKNSPYRTGALLPPIWASPNV
ncbi:UNVERIFIED_CONTAM: hypothetical protein NCL1_33422 [Trichonephila clavipes]